MKTPKIVKLLVILTGFAALGTPRCYGQSEIDPDHFDSPNTEPFSQPKTKEADAAEKGKMRFDGKVTLPYTLICAGQRLPSGRYTVSLRSDGKMGRATLNQRSQSLEIAGAVRPQADPHAGNILLIECLGKAHRLSAIHVNAMELVFDSSPQVEHTSDGKPRRTEKLLLTRSSPQKWRQFETRSESLEVRLCGWEEAESNMALTTRRQLIQQTAFAAAALYTRPINALAGARRTFETGEQKVAPLDAAAIRKLVSQISGHLITPETPDYESARMVFNRAFDRRPALIVRCAGAPDVARALEFAQNQNLPLAVRGGGHNRMGFSVCDAA
jgi:hypothetical protein